MSDARGDILNLIHTFADHFDNGDFGSAMAMFDRGEFKLSTGQTVTPEGMREIWDMTVRLYDGSPRTQHNVTNHIVTIDEHSGFAECRSRYTVHQWQERGEIITVALGRYIDRFARDEDGWYFTERDYAHLDYVGDISAHLTEAAMERFIDNDGGG